MAPIKKKGKICSSCGKLMASTDLKKNVFLFKCSNCDQEISMKMGKKKKK